MDSNSQWNTLKVTFLEKVPLLKINLKKKLPFESLNYV